MAHEQGYSPDEQGVQCPLASSIKNNLADKNADKRKQAAQDISDAVRALLHGTPQTALAIVPSESPDQQVATLIRYLVEEYCRSGFPAKRKGGLIGLASIAIALERSQVQSHVVNLVPPVLICFSDEDVGVRYNACEAFYNIAKVARQGILPFFSDVFDGLCKLYADVEQSVKEGGQCLDRLVRDIVTESREFSYADFVPLLATRLRVLNPFVRQLVLGWIILVDSVPEVDMIAHLPLFLEGLFGILASDNRDIRHSAEDCLKELLTEIKGRSRARTLRAIADAAPTVARCCRAGERRAMDGYVRLTALAWLCEFMRLQVESEYTSDLEAPNSPPPELANHSGPYQVAGGLHLNRHRSRDRSGKGDADGDTAVSTSNFRHRRQASTGESPKPTRQQRKQKQDSQSGTALSGLQELTPVLLEGALHCLDDAELEIRQHAEQANKALLDGAQRLGHDLPVEAIMEVVLGAMQANVPVRSEAVLLACFRWARLLLERCPTRVLRPAVCEKLFQACLAELSRPEDEVATTALRLIAQLVSTRDEVYGVDDGVGTQPRPEDALGESMPQHRRVLSSGSSPTDAGACGNDVEAPLPSGEFLSGFCRRLFVLLADNSGLLASRGELLVRELCAGVGAMRFYEVAAQAVVSEAPEGSFARRFVRVLNQVLLTSRETKELRVSLFAAATRSARPGAPDVIVSTTAESLFATPTMVFTLPSDGDGDGVPPLLLSLLRSWFHCPVSTLALCLWLHWFELAAEVTARLAELEFTQELQSQLDDFVELLESPVFMRVRLQMLETHRNPALLHAILGLVALLPREQKLRARLAVVETDLLLEKLVPGCRAVVRPASPPLCKAANTLLQRFDSVADQHDFRRCIL